MIINTWLREILVCPRDKNPLTNTNDQLVCPANHRYPVVDGTPIMLLGEIDPTHHYITETLTAVGEHGGTPESNADAKNDEGIDPFVQDEVPHTCGNLYFPIRYKLDRYPIPDLRLPDGHGKRLLDIGCNWGRWTVAAALKGYQPIGIDPSLKAVMAARNVCRQSNVSADFVVADARHLPFADDSFDVAFSYLVLQSFAKNNARIALKEIARALRPDGIALIQMPNKFGLRSIYQQIRRGFREGENFDIRYWTPAELKRAFENEFGTAAISADCFFGLGLQKNDIDLLPARFRAVVHSSEFLRRGSLKLPWLVNFADSVYLRSTNQK